MTGFEETATALIRVVEADAVLKLASRQAELSQGLLVRMAELGQPLERFVAFQATLDQLLAGTRQLTMVVDQMRARSAELLAIHRRALLAGAPGGTVRVARQPGAYPRPRC